MRFEAAWLSLLALPLLAYLAWLTRRSYAQLAPAARWASLAVRGGVMLLLLAALTRPTWQTRSAANHVIFLLDVSQSISGANMDAALEQIDQLARAALASGSAPRISLAAFGQSVALLVRGATRWDGWEPALRQKLTYGRALTELYEQRTQRIGSGAPDGDPELASLAARIADLERFRDGVAGQCTDIARGLRLALNCGASDERRTIYVLSDANFNRGTWPAAGAATTGAQVHLIVLDRPPPPEVAASDLGVPSSVRVDQGFSAEVRIASTVETPAELRVFKDGYLQQERQVSLRAGENVFRVPGLYFREKGFHAVEMSVKAAQDTQLANNRARALVVVPGEARVLYVDRDIEQIPYLKGALELEGIQVEARSAAGVPQNLSDLLSFDAFVLCNVPADRLSMRQMQMIRTYVQDFGGGFVMVGGDESFGLGGYYNTPIEEILPVKMPIQKDVLRPSLAVMLVIDKSGSMEGAKIQLAKRAALATAEAINPRDLIGVIGFDGEARVLLDLTPAGDQATIAAHIAGLEAGGGTFLYPALQQAHEDLTNSNARRKHVIVLSDGQTQGFGYEELVSNMAADAITLSTVGIGDGADMNLMEAMATAGGGRTYFTNDFNTIPQIFTREALRASRSMLIERLVQPAVVSRDASLDEIDTDELPVLTGYVATTPKPSARTLIVSDSGDPILAKWRVGLGRTAAFTSEPKPRWAEDWVEWEDFAKFWSQLVRSVTGQDLAQSFQIEATHRLDGADAILCADVRDTAGVFADGLTLELSTFAPSGRSTPLPVSRQGPGLYEARVPDFKYGEDHQFVWRVRLPEGRRADARPSKPDTETAAPGDDGTPAAAADPPTPSAAAPVESDAQYQTASYGFVYAFSPEFATLAPSAEAIEQVRTLGLGDVASVGQAQFISNPALATRWVRLWPYLLVAVLLLTPLDILIRRLG
jgi:Ca-activated chloride channel homolog